MIESTSAELLQRINEAFQGGVVPHNTALGLVAVDCGPGFAVARLPYAAALVGNPATGVLHGGAVTAALDATAGLAVLLRMDAPTRIATLDLRIDYLGSGTPGRDLFARAECYKLTRNVAFVRGVAYHDDPSEPVASAAATFMIFRDAESGSARALERP